MKFFKILLFFLLISNFSFAVKSEAKNPLIITSINPLHQILLAITADQNNSILIIDPNISEHDYQLKKRDLESFSKADLIFYIDDDLEKNFPKLIKNFAAEKKSYQLSKVNNIKLLPQRSNPQKNDVHIWLNPQNAIKIAEFMTQKICAIDPENSQKYQKNFKIFKKEISKTEKIIRAELEKIKSVNYVFYHDGYQYFEDYFGIKPLKIMSYDHNRELAVKDIRELDSLVKTGQVKCIFGEANDEKNSAKKLAKNYNLRFFILDFANPKEILKNNSSQTEASYGEVIMKLASSIVECSR
jgi:zinc transport system substrate-binding protein